MAGVKAWYENLEPKERSAVLVLALIGAGVLLFVAGTQVGQALAAFT
ncbi:hypothetical protein [Marinicauda algicola]|nr:hypothetical protein [Marinicauda algicola]